MTNNYILRQLRYTFEITDLQMIELFAMAGKEVNRSEISDWLKKEDDPTYINLVDKNLSYFLNGFIIKNRGRKEGSLPIAESKLDNNIIFRKLKIALNLKDDDILEFLSLANFKLSKHELSAFFRKPNQTQYRKCKD